ncbi:Hypothetical protein CINCED_3A024853 [Cinara cedri]|uniref:Uncharacterized protein n=1 Tax=Cinara cedri TaxID=506608 RepID=A0A5E4NKL9_9HEMI|nr:Hypothetical protein CINCED_3A024853 [Cinara cedri]
MRKHFKDTISLIYTDADSLVYHIKTQDFYLDLLNKPGLLECTDTTYRKTTRATLQRGRRYLICSLMSRMEEQ